MTQTPANHEFGGVVAEENAFSEKASVILKDERIWPHYVLSLLLVGLVTVAGFGIVEKITVANLDMLYLLAVVITPCSGDGARQFFLRLRARLLSTSFLSRPTDPSRSPIRYT